MVLPEVEETSHFRFRVPVWKVRDARRSFLGLEAEHAWRQQAPKRLTAEYEG